MKGISYENITKLDKKDRKILKALYENARMNIATLAKKTKLRRDTIARRIKQMEKNGVISGFIPVINPPALGLPNIAIILLKTKTESKEKKTFQNKVVGNKYITHVATLIGKFDFYCAIVYQDTGHLNTIIEDVKQYIPEFIIDFEIFQVAEEPKFERMEDLL
ncbi:Lrp/AsnC family transcriptional regulator [Candidatus Woesearchaeota archaeon]|jgi:DNA-binding Lrp family transcriptional regulator|nr:Lrp/AsnC family transcriptional regulator [Candidatus Woesearchaeota archaeon]MBT5396741.1 Lrp/AsnC family transcriptional regulator [Candidatus Woesearchaeota archaeon]MBT6367629.1 Lrp/AsnC family transcriptional regulator [Candidatus Woesearchaeota archaeon]MBT7762971.1 Lrp/AsnC family transcriptional regulator [Candidatus Woesearchaeota archaeon]